MEEALYYEPCRDGTVICRLCPHACRIRDGQYGFCRVRHNRNGRLYTDTDHSITGAAYDPVEKKPFRQWQPGRTIFSIGNFGCSFHCDFCQNHEIVHNPHTVRTPILDEKLLRLAGANGSVGIAFTYNEPIVGYEMMYRLAQKSRAAGLLTAVISNGFICTKPLKALIPYIDAWNIDLKMADDVTYRRICGGTMEDVLRTIRICHEMCHVEVTTLLIEGLNTGCGQVDRIARAVADISPDIPLHLTRYFPAFRRTTPATPLQTIYEAQETAMKHLKYVYLGNV